MHEHMPYYLDRVPGLLRSGTDYRAPCPLHGGKNPESFSVNPETGQWYCQSGCLEGGDAIRLEQRLTGCGFAEARATVERVIGMPIAVNDIPRQTSSTPEKVVQLHGKIVATYDYRDENGTLIYQVVRKDPKAFLQRRPDGNGNWNYSIKGIERILYHLQDISMSSGPVWIFEGEKDVDNARKLLKLEATCNSGGAGKFTSAMAKHIAGREVFIVQDNDTPGKKHAEQVAQYCALEGCKVKIFGLPAAKDFTEWHTKGGTLDALMEIASKAPYFGSDAIKELPEQPNDTSIPANVIEMLKNYVILVGSNMIWDSRRCKTSTPNELRLSHAQDFNVWVKHAEARKVDVEKLVFKPQGSEPGELNIFTGIKMQPNPKGECGKIIDHIALICGGDPDLTHWLTAWLAYPLQHLGAKMMTSVVVHGPQGCGKNLFFEQAVVAIYGEYGDMLGQPEIESTYTGWASRKLFAVADEVISRAERALLKNKIKALITGDTIGIEEKYQSRRTEENHLNLVFLSNEDIPVFIEAGDRRFTVIHMDEVYNPEYYDNLAKEIKSGGVEAFYDYLLNYDLKGFNPHTKPYETQAKKEIVKACVNPAERFLDEWQSGELPIPFCCCESAHLFEAYRVWATASGERFSGTQTSFGRIASKRFQRVRTRSLGEKQATYYLANKIADPEQASTFKYCLDSWLENQQKRRL